MPWTLLAQIRQHKKAVFALIVAIGVAIWIVVVLSNPLRRSPERIEGWLLKQTPRGTPIDRVRAALKQKGWYDPTYPEDRGYTETYHAEDTIGEYTLRGDLGVYRPFSLRFYLLGVYTEAYWVFDRDQRLIAIQVKKYGEGP